MAQLNVEEFLQDFEIADDAEREALTKFFSREKNQKPAWQLKDYSRTMQELAAQRTEMEEAVAQKETALARQAELLADWKKSNEGALLKAQNDAARAQKRIERIAEDYGIDPESVEVGEAPKPKKEAVDLSGYVKADDMTRGLEALVDISTDLFEVKEDYQELYQKPMRDVKGFVREFAKAKQKEPDLTLTGFADRKFEFSQKREEAKTTALRKQIEEEVEAKYRKEFSERSLPYVPRREGQGSALFRKDRPAPGGAKGKGREAVLSHLREKGLA